MCIELKRQTHRYHRCNWAESIKLRHRTTSRTLDGCTSWVVCGVLDSLCGVASQRPCLRPNHLSWSRRTPVQSSHVWVQFLDDSWCCVTCSRPLVRRHAPSVVRRLNLSLSFLGRPIAHGAATLPTKGPQVMRRLDRRRSCTALTALLRHSEKDRIYDNPRSNVILGIVISVRSLSCMLCRCNSAVTVHIPFNDQRKLCSQGLKACIVEGVGVYLLCEMAE